MDRFWDAIDISNNLSRTRSVIVSMAGMPALFFALLFVLPMTVASGMLAWSFDVLPTISSTQHLTAYVGSSLPDRFANYASMVVLALTIAPTVFELGGAAFARSGQTPFQGIVIALSIFDMVTDAPQVNGFLYNSWDFFERFGVLTYPAYWAAWALWLLCASFFFEMVFVCSFVAFIGLMLRAAASNKTQQTVKTA